MLFKYSVSQKKDLTNRIESLVRYSEVDSMNVVWHGNYLKYLEDGREAFGREYAIGYHDVYANQLMTPIVKLNIDYKRSVSYEDKVIIETKFIDCDAAKLIFDYIIYRESDQKVAVTARTVQVFINLQGELELTLPAFFLAWKKKWGLLA